MGKTCQQRLRRKQADACSGQFDGQGQSIQANTDLGDGASIGLPYLEIRLDSLRTLGEKSEHRILRQEVTRWEVLQVRQGQGRDGKFLFAVEPQGGAAGHQQVQVRAGGQQVGKPWCSRQHLFEVVEEQQEGVLTERHLQLFSYVSCSRLVQTKRLGDGREHEVGIADGSQGHQAHPVREVGGEVCCRREQQAGFADAAWTGEGEQTHLGSTEQGRELGALLLAAKQGSEWNGQIGKDVPGLHAVRHG